MIFEEQIAAFRRWCDILKKDGLLPSIKRTLSFIMRSLYRYENLYLYCTSVEEEVARPYCKPKTAGFRFKAITRTAQVDELIADGFRFDFFLLANDRRLRRGAIAFCIFIEKQLVYISWLATNRRAKDAIAEIPRPVDFATGETYTGWTFRSQKHWRASSGFTSFMHSSIVRYVQRKGYKAFKFEIDKNNKVMINTLAKRSQVYPYRQACNIKLLWWKSWRESDLEKTASKAD